MTFGDFELMPVPDGFLSLDGGAMFGIVPKPLWERRIAADARNRIRLGMRPLVVRTGRHTMLIDAGIGDKMSAKDQDIYAIDRTPSLDRSLSAAGIAPADIDVVIATHLHFDHVGGLTRARRRSARARVSRRPPRHPPGRVGRCDAPARAESRELHRGQFRAARRRRPRRLQGE